MSWNSLFVCLITSDCLPKTHPTAYRTSGATGAQYLTNSITREETKCATACPSAARATNPPAAHLWLLWCTFLWLLWCVFRRRASLVAMVQVSLVAMVRVSTHTRRQPANHASTHPKITMVMNKGTMVSIYRGERTYPTTTNRGTTHTPSVAMVRITPLHTRPAHKPPACTSKSKSTLHPA